MNRNKLLKIFFPLFVLTAKPVFAYDNTQIVGTTYTDVSFTYYEASLPYVPYKISQPWIRITDNGVVAVAQVKEVGPNNFYDDYWQPSASRDMFQNLSQWMPQAEWVGNHDGTQPSRVIAHPDFVGESDYYVNPSVDDPNVGTHFYQSFTAGERFATTKAAVDPALTPTALDDPNRWEASASNGGIDLSGGVWQHLGKDAKDGNISEFVGWDFYQGPVPTPAIQLVNFPQNQIYTTNTPVITANVEDDLVGMDEGSQQQNNVQSPATIRFFLRGPNDSSFQEKEIVQNKIIAYGKAVNEIEISFTPDAPLPDGAYVLEIDAINNANIGSSLNKNFIIQINSPTPTPTIETATPTSVYTQTYTPEPTDTPTPAASTFTNTPTVSPTLTLTPGHQSSCFSSKDSSYPHVGGDPNTDVISVVEQPCKNFSQYCGDFYGNENFSGINYTKAVINCGNDSISPAADGVPLVPKGTYGFTAPFIVPENVDSVEVTLTGGGGTITLDGQPFDVGSPVTYDFTSGEVVGHPNSPIHLNHGTNQFVFTIDFDGGFNSCLSLNWNICEGWFGQPLPPTDTPTSTDTFTPTPTDTPTGSHTPTETDTFTNTYTPSPTPTFTFTDTFTPTPTFTPFVWLDTFPTPGPVPTVYWVYGQGMSGIDNNYGDTVQVTGTGSGDTLQFGTTSSGSVPIHTVILNNGSATDETVEADVVLGPNSVSEGTFGLVFHAQDGANYDSFVWDASSQTWKFLNYRSNSIFNLFSAATPKYPVGASVHMKVVCQGFSFKCYVNFNDCQGDRLIFDVFDTAYVSGYAGMQAGGFPTGETADFSNFRICQCLETITPTCVPGSNAWIKATGAAQFTPRVGQQSIFYKNKIWVVGGLDNTGYKNDVWNSDDGINWNLVTANAPFGPRAYFSLLVFNDKLWVISGDDGYDNVYNDAWFSPDGANWTETSDSNGSVSAPKVTEMCGVVFAGKMWLFGGYSIEGVHGLPRITEGVVYSSSDGILWSTSQPAGFAPGPDLRAVVVGNVLYVVGQKIGDNFLSVWSTTDGVNWSMSQAVDSSGEPLTNAGSVYSDGSNLFIVSSQPSLNGLLDENNFYSAVISTNPAVWSRLSTKPNILNRVQFSSAQSNGSFWLIGGQDSIEPQALNNDIWYYRDSNFPTFTQTPTLTRTNTPTPTITLSPTSTMTPIVWRVDCGSSNPYTDPNGNVWAADENYSGSSSKFSNSRVVRNPGNLSIPQGAPLYQTQRIGAPVTYIFQEPAYLDCQVTLKIGCLYSGVCLGSGCGPNTYPVGIAINGIPETTVYTSGGASYTPAIDRVYDNINSDLGGAITIVINGFINAIQILPESQTVPATPTPNPVQPNGSAFPESPACTSGSCALGMNAVASTGTMPVPRYAPVLYSNPALSVNGMPVKTMVMAGGFGSYHNDVWATSDGTNWTQLTANAAFSPRGQHAGVYFNNKMWLMGGYDGSNFLNDLWSSSDGVNWNLIANPVLDQGRAGHSMVVFDGKMWIIGGQTSSGFVNDVWSSDSSGNNWIRATQDPGFTPRAYQACLVFNNQLWIFGGTDDSGPLNDVWSSADGVHWQSVPQLSGFPAKSKMACFTYNGFMVLMGGLGVNGDSDDAWYSADGQNWIQTAAPMPFSIREQMGYTLFDDRFWIFDGFNGVDGTDDGDVWVTDSMAFALSPTPVLTGTPTITPTPTYTWSPTQTFTPTETFSVTSTWTPIPTDTPSTTPTEIPTETRTATNTFTPTVTLTATPSLTTSPTSTWTKTETGTWTPTSTKTWTPTLTATVTRTLTPTWTPTPPLACVGILTSPKLDLQVGCFQRDNQQERFNVRVTNWGSAPVTLGDLSIRMWMNESQLCNMQQWVESGQLFQAGGSGAVNVANTGFTATANWMASSCAVDPSHKANQVILFTPNGSHQTIPSNGGYWGGGFNLGIGRNNPQMDDAWADDYSKTSVCSGGLTEDSHFALYYDGTLLLEWSENAVQDTQSGAEPCCGGTVHASMISKQDIVLGGPTQTPTTAVGTDAWSVTAAPNMTDGRQPVQFQVRLDRPEKITLKLYTLLGEKICEDQVMGTAGPNILIWRAQNEAKQSVASGIYLYAVQIEGQTGMFKSGKVLVLH